jgi:HAD superfamily hydrolase (TIGR01509 family)
MFKAVIFDWDGTLANTKVAILISFHKALELISYQVPDEYIERRIGIGAADTFRGILKSAGMSVDEEIVRKLVELKSLAQIQLSNQVHLFFGAKELLEVLQGKVKLGLASMNNRSVIMDLLKRNNIIDCFDAVLTIESVSYSKPDPEIFLKVAHELGVVPSDCVVLEDSLFGVKAAKTAGMGCVAVTTGVYSKQELYVERPDLIVESLADPRILRFLLNNSGLW